MADGRTGTGPAPRSDGERSLNHVRPRIGDQVRITDRTHPWVGAIGLVRDRFANQDDYWEIELETILPGQRAMAHESEFRRV